MIYVLSYCLVVQTHYYEVKNCRLSYYCCRGLRQSNTVSRGRFRPCIRQLHDQVSAWPVRVIFIRELLIKSCFLHFSSFYAVLAFAAMHSTSQGQQQPLAFENRECFIFPWLGSLMNIFPIFRFCRFMGLLLDCCRRILLRPALSRHYSRV